MPYKLGLKPARHDSRTLRLARYFTATLPEPPESVDWSVKVKHWPMLLNDQLGCCAIAAPLHDIQSNTANANSERVPNDKLCLAGYQAVGHYDPSNPQSDQGCVMLDVMNYWRTHGFGGHKIKAYASVEPSDPHAVQTASWLFGGLLLGLNMPLGWQGLQAGETWRAPAKNFRRGKWAPGSWGGHAVNVVAYDTHTLTVVTWGGLQKMSWNAFDSYCTEAYCDMSDDWLNRVTHKAPSGFDSAALESDLHAITG